MIKHQPWATNGEWWLPDQPQQRGRGVLRFDLTLGLTLTGVVAPWFVFDPAALQGVFPPAPGVILGRADSGERYTCVRNFFAHISQNGLPGGDVVTVADIDTQTVLKGQHFADVAEIIFRRFSAVYTNLHCWLFDIPYLELQEVPEQVRTYQVRHSRGTLWETPIQNGLTVSNDFSFKSGTSYDPTPAITFNHLDGLLLTSEVARTLDELFQTEHKFRALVNLLGDCQLETASIKCHELQGGGIDGIACYDDRMTKGFREREDARRGIMPVPFSEIAGNFAEILQHWFGFYEQLGPVVSLYLFGKHNRYLDIDNIFLGLILGLERYHRSFHGGVFMPQEEYDANVRPLLNGAIPDLVQGSFRQRLRSAIQYGYEFSLRRRLNDLINTLPNTATFAEARNPGFIGATVDTRNSLAHQVHGPDMHILAGPALYNAINVWREVLFALVLNRLHFQPQVIDLAVRRLQTRRGHLVIP